MENNSNACATNRKTLFSFAALSLSSLPSFFFFFFLVFVFFIVCVLYIDDNCNLFLLLNQSSIVEDILKDILFSAITVI